MSAHLNHYECGMIAILRANGDGELHRYPSKPEITAMTKRKVQYYPMLQDQGTKNTWVSEMHPVYYQSVSCWTFSVVVEKMY